MNAGSRHRTPGRPGRLALVPLLAAALAALGCDREEPGRVPPVSEADVVVSPIGSTAAPLGFPARIVAADEVEIATRTSGIVRRVEVDVGSDVRPGQLLLALEAGDVAAGVAAARAHARLARKSHERIAALEADGAATPQELDEAEARLESTEAAVREAETQLGYVRLSAPIHGVVTERRVDPGDLVVPGQTALTIASTAELEIEADLPARRAGLVEPGTLATVIDPRSGARAPVRVTRVVPALETTSRRFRVEAAFDGPAPDGILPGEFARLEIEPPGARTRWIPADAVVRRGQLTGVYVVEDDTLRLRWVRLGRERSGAVELLSGPSGDARLVRDPAPELADGRPVGRIESRPWEAGEDPASPSERTLSMAEVEG